MWCTCRLLWQDNPFLTTTAIHYGRRKLPWSIWQCRDHRDRQSDWGGHTDIPEWLRWTDRQGVYLGYSRVDWHLITKNSHSILPSCWFHTHLPSFWKSTEFVWFLIARYLFISSLSLPSNPVRGIAVVSYPFPLDVAIGKVEFFWWLHAIQLSSFPTPWMYKLRNLCGRCEHTSLQMNLATRIYWTQGCSSRLWSMKITEMFGDVRLARGNIRSMVRWELRLYSSVVFSFQKSWECSTIWSAKRWVTGWKQQTATLRWCSTLCMYAVHGECCTRYQLTIIGLWDTEAGYNFEWLLDGRVQKEKERDERRCGKLWWEIGTKENCVCKSIDHTQYGKFY